MGRRSTEISPVYNAPPLPGVTCPRCGRVFEQPATIGDVALEGHVQGGRTCVPVATMTGAERDARARKAARKGMS